MGTKCNGSLFYRYPASCFATLYFGSDSSTSGLFRSDNTVSVNRSDGRVVTLDGSWELKVAKYFDNIGIEWERNTKRFPYINLKGKDATYCPDFYLPSKDLYIEVKGYTTDLDKCKWSQFTKKLEVWTKKELLQFGIFTIKSDTMHA